MSAHEIAQSLADQSAFYAEHPRGEPSQWEAAPDPTQVRVVDCTGCRCEVTVYIFDGDEAAVDVSYVQNGWFARDFEQVWRDGEDYVGQCAVEHVNREETCGETLRWTPNDDWTTPDAPESHPAQKPILDAEPTVTP